LSSLLLLLMSAPVFAALPGVTEFKMAPEKIPDAELSELLRERVAGADVIAIGETVHGSSALLKLQARLSVTWLPSTAYG
jgi:erythromycin esterase-like protein